jgi:hypothetical protein
MRVGVDVMRAAADNRGSASVSTFATTTSGWSSEALLKAGANEVLVEYP